MKGTPASNRKKDATEKRFIEIASYCPVDQFGDVLSEVTLGRPGLALSEVREQSLKVRSNYEQSQILIAVYPAIEEHRQECLCYTVYRDTTASRAVEQLKNRHRP